MTIDPDEENTLLSDPSSPASSSSLKFRGLPVHAPSRDKTTPLPKLQISIILLIQLSEPITSQCIYPFINQLIRELDITGGDEHKVGYYAGLIETLFFATEAITVLQWSRLSDSIGRKPVILIGLSGIFLSMLFFGLSRTFWGLVISRCLCGMLNGNIGVIKALMAEIADTSNMAQAFSLLPITWSVGATIGPFWGGTLSRPHERFPRYFSGQFWKTYPYFLPCAVSGSVSAVSFVATLLFLKETIQKRKLVKEPTNFVLQVVGGGTTSNEDEPYFAPPPARSKEDPVPLRGLLVFPVLISIANYVLLAFLDIARASLQPLFFSTPLDVGGLGMSPPLIGLVLGLYGLCNGVLQALFLPRAVKRWGPRRLFLCGMFTFLPVFALFPIMSLLAMNGGVSLLVWMALLAQILLSMIVDMSYACIFMFVTSSAPNKRSLGATNGLSQTAVSIARATGPAMATSIFAFSAEHNLLGGYAVYVVFIVLTCLSLLFAVQLPDELWTREHER